MQHSTPRLAPPTSLKALLWIVGAGFFMQTVDSTIVNTALPSMARSLGVAALTMQPVVVAYTLTMAVLTPASGWLSDRFGTRNLYFAAILVFVLGSVLCVVSTTLPLLIAARVVQAVGGAMLLPVGRLAVLRSFPKDQYLGALTFVSIAGQVGPLVGPLLGGWIVQFASWHWIFLLNVPIGAAGCVAVARYLKVDRDAPPPARFDWLGFALIAVCMASFTLALDPQAAAAAAYGVGLLALSASCALGYWALAKRRAAPLFPLGIFSQPGFNLGLLGNLVARIGSSAVPFLMPLMLQLQMGKSPMVSGLMLVPVALAGVLTKRWINPLVARYGYTRFLVGNTIIMGISMAALGWLSDGIPLVLQCVLLAVFGGANSLQFAGMNGVTLKDLGPRYSGSGNSLFSMVQMLAIGLGVTVAARMVQIVGDVTGNGLLAFRVTFFCVGAITCASLVVFVYQGRAIARSRLPTR